MRPYSSQKLTTFAAWTTLILTVAVCTLGLKLTALQYDAVRSALFDSQRQLANEKSQVLAEVLDNIEDEVLSEMEVAAGEADLLRSIARRHPVIATPFLLTASGSVELPLINDDSSYHTLIATERTPEDFSRALRLAYSNEALDRKLATLDALATDDSTEPRWRLRAATLAAGLARKQTSPPTAGKSAVERYAAILREFGGAVRQSTSRPSYWQVNLAYAESLTDANRSSEAFRVLTNALHHLEKDEIAVSVAEERYFVHRANEIFGLSATRPAVLVRLFERQSDTQAWMTAAATLRDWLAALTRLHGSAPAGRTPPYFFELVEGQPVLAVWRPAHTESLTAEIDAVGFLANIEALENLCTARLVKRSGAQRLKVRIANATDDLRDQELRVASLGGTRWLFHLGLPVNEWEELLGRARLPFVYAGALIALLAIILVLGILTFLRGLRQEILLSRMKTEFVANVSHELKTPLALIRLFAETLALDRVRDDGQRQKYFETITRESERLAHLIDNVLNFSSIEAGKKNYTLVPMDIGETVRDVANNYAFQLDAKGFKWRAHIDRPLPLVEADADAVSQAVINLLENAIKYSPERKQIEVEAVVRNGEVHVTVRDQGVGIASEDQGKVWDDYFRTKKARALGTRGSGLGLSVVQHIMESHHGRVELQSSPGKGSAFTLVFPTVSKAEIGSKSPLSDTPNGMDTTDGESKSELQKKSTHH